MADVFPTEVAITAAGWSSQDASDLLAVLGPRLVGVPANRIPAFCKRLGGRRSSQWQAQVDAERDAKHKARQGRRLVASPALNPIPQTPTTMGRVV